MVKEVYIIHYMGACEIDVCETLKAAEQYGRRYLDEIKFEVSQETFDKMMQEFESTLKEYDGQFSVEEVMWVEVQPLLSELE